MRGVEGYCQFCVVWFVLMGEYCVEKTLGECDCPKCQGLCECGVH